MQTGCCGIVCSTGRRMSWSAWTPSRGRHVLRRLACQQSGLESVARDQAAIVVEYLWATGVDVARREDVGKRSGRVVQVALGVWDAREAGVKMDNRSVKSARDRKFR
jgi:hypothetical protein